MRVSSTSGYFGHAISTGPRGLPWVAVEIAPLPHICRLNVVGRIVDMTKPALLAGFVSL